MDVGHRKGPPDRRRMRPGGNETGGTAIALTGIPVTGTPSTGDDEAHEALRDPALRQAGERGAANEVARLLELHDAPKAGLEWVRAAVQLVAVERHPGFEAQGISRPEPARDDVRVMPGTHQRRPHVGAHSPTGEDLA